MEHPLADEDLATLVLRALASAYADEARRACTDHRGASPRPSPEQRAIALRTMLRQALHAMGMASRVCALWRRASAVAIDALLELVAAQFRGMHVAVLDFLRREPALYEGASLAPGVPREESVRVLPNSWSGQNALAPLRACFEVPVPTPPRGGGVPAPIGNVRNPIAPYRQTFAHWRPRELARQARVAGHWLRAWTAELTWVDPPTRSPKALWLATNRGCAVCGTQCLLQGRRVDLVHAEHHNTEEFDKAIDFDDRAPGPGRSPWVGLNAYIEVPWDLPSVHTRLVGVGVPHDPVTRLATRILPYTHRAHMVTLVFRNERRDAAAQERSESYKCYFTTPPGVDQDDYDQTEDEIALANVLQALEAVPHPNDDRWSHGRCIRRLFAKRRDAIRDSGMQQYMLEHGATTREIDKVRHATEFRATLPLSPMHGHPETHCWCSVFDLSEAQFRRLAWDCPPPSAALEQVERWRKQAFRHAIAFLSERLPRFDHSVFFRASEVEPSGDRLGHVPLACITATFVSRLLNPVEHARRFHEHLPDPNEMLLETWPALRELRPSADYLESDEDEDDESVDARRTRLKREWRETKDAVPTHLDVTYDKMLNHFVRLDTVLGPAWRYAHYRNTAHKVAHVLHKIATRHLERTPDLAPAPGMVRHSRIIPGLPRHLDVWMRWALRALADPELRPRGSEPAPCSFLDVDMVEAFVIDNANQCDGRVAYDNVGVVVTFYVLTRKPDTGSLFHFRAVFQIRMSSLEEIRAGLCDTEEELEGLELEGWDWNSLTYACTSEPTLVDEPKALALWHRCASGTCDRMTRYLRQSTPLAIDLLRRLLDAESLWEHPSGASVDGWEWQRSKCDAGSGWFADNFCD